MKHGFTLIELLVVLTLTAFLLPMLFTSLYQCTEFKKRVDTLVDIHMRIGVAANQLEKDLMGAFVPVQADKKDAEKKEIEKIFFSVHKDKQLQTLSFISNNPVQAYVGQKVGKIKPKIVRTHYTIQPEEDHPSSYILMRQESEDLDAESYKDYKKILPTELLHGIKSFSCVFTACIEKKKEDKKQLDAQATEQSQKPDYEYKIVSEWSSEKKESEKTNSTPWPLIPCRVVCTIVLWDIDYTQEHKYTVIADILIDDAIAKQEQQKPDAQKQVAQEKSENNKALVQSGKNSNNG